MIQSRSRKELNHGSVSDLSTAGSVGGVARAASVYALRLSSITSARIGQTLPLGPASWRASKSRFAFARLGTRAFNLVRDSISGSWGFSWDGTIRLVPYNGTEEVYG